MTNEQVQKYLQRIRFDGEITLTEATLDKLIWRHLTSVPFENLDVVDLKKVPSLDPEYLYTKVVEHNRGGYCFELNRLLYGLLETLGFQVMPVNVRISMGKPLDNGLPPALHRATIAILNGKKYFCDVGFGGPGPQGLLELTESPTVQTIRGRSFRTSVMDSGFYLIENFADGAYRPLHVVDNRKAEEADFEIYNHFCATFEKGMFTLMRVINLSTENGSLALTNDSLTIREGEKVEKRTLATEEEFQKCLRELYGICM